MLVRTMLDLVLRSAGAAIAAIPRQRRYSLADAITAVVPLCAPRLYARTRRNFSDALNVSTSEAGRLARSSIRNFGRMAVDFLWIRGLANSDVERVCQLSNEHYLWDALGGGRGVILVLPHLGCWDVAAARASAAGLPIVIVTESSWAARLAATSRERPGIALAPRDRSPRTLLQALHRNEGVVLLSDLVRPGVQTLTVPFFGLEAPLPSGPARLSAHTSAPIVVLACVRTSPCRYRIDFRPPIWPAEQSVQDLTQRIAAEFGVLIRRYPDQWYPFGRIWTTARASRDGGVLSPRQCAKASSLRR
jgi:KDO2-lipid IV(A) lauroyltransferase